MQVQTTTKKASASALTKAQLDSLAAKFRSGKTVNKADMELLIEYARKLAGHTHQVLDRVYDAYDASSYTTLTEEVTAKSLGLSYDPASIPVGGEVTSGRLQNIVELLDTLHSHRHTIKDTERS